MTDPADEPRDPADQLTHPREPSSAHAPAPLAGPVTAPADPTLLGLGPVKPPASASLSVLEVDAAPASTELPAGRSEPVASAAAVPRRSSYLFLGLVAGVTLVLDLWSKAWAERRLDGPDAYFHPVVLIKDHVDFVLAKNRGGAWGLLQDTPEYVRRPFFLIVSALAITFIVSLYRKLGPEQRAMRWGLPLVLGGALGNLVDRVRYSHVIDFIHVHARWGGRDHSWPTFNVADIAICIGVGLMAVDMFTSPSPSETKTADAP